MAIMLMDEKYIYIYIYMMNTDYLIHLVKTYFSTVFFLWIVANILLRLLVTKRKKKRKKGKRGGGIEIIWLPIYNVLCFLLKLFTIGFLGCGHKEEVEDGDYDYFFRRQPFSMQAV
tara:strand:- start:72 stop:419 length:348 start_codon:yes stop_codon:yes gene_type:complete